MSKPAPGEAKTNRGMVPVARKRNRKGFDDLAAYTSKVRTLATLPKRAEPVLRRAVESDTKSNAAKGKDPDGNPWRRSKDGRAVLQNAAKAISVSVSSAVILITVTGRHARHHLGIVRGTGSKGERARRIIPTSEIPKTTTRAMERAATGEFRRIMK